MNQGWRKGTEETNLPPDLNDSRLLHKHVLRHSWLLHVLVESHQSYPCLYTQLLPNTEESELFFHCLQSQAFSIAWRINAIFIQWPNEWVSIQMEVLCQWDVLNGTWHHKHIHSASYWWALHVNGASITLCTQKKWSRFIMSPYCSWVWSKCMTLTKRKYLTHDLATSWLILV